MVVLRNAAKLNSLSGLAVTKLDVLDDMDEIKICIAYEHKGKTITNFPAEIKLLQECTPVYESHPGWKQNISKVREFKDLPINAQKYLARLEELSGVKIKIISVGPGREATIIKERIFK